ncbi:peptidoglycan-binding protein [Pannus brasiliensis CCIBt3594]|uniref:Peptidoglycan-binding protein n=1 Tax=Pannus brasiliensis CCIBt3594 TaxID=1427578 RepID=A0AAW9QH63_9CHRO
MSEHLTVKEFSRKLLEPKQDGEQWVSTGFDKEIGLRTAQVPSCIENAVNNHWFRINDSYPPAEGEIALIAREIEQYAVLAVASPLIDDSERPLVGYRYFWLEKPADGEIDAVGTLLIWWTRNDRPRFGLKSFQEIESIQRQHYQQDFYSTKIYASYDLQRNLQFENLASSIQNTPYIFYGKNIFTHWHLHFFSWYLNQKHARPIAWAWNATVLENPDRFTLIACANEEYCQKNLDANKIKSGLVTTSILRDFSDNSPVQVKSIQALKKAFKEVSEDKNIPENFSTLVQELQLTDSTRWDWYTLIDATWLSGLPDSHSPIESKSIESKYKSLILLLHPQLQHTDLKLTISDWIDGLKFSGETVSRNEKSLFSYLSRFRRSSQPVLPINREGKVALDRQHELIQACRENQLAYAQIKNRLQKIIASLFLLLRSRNSSEDSEIITWLLLDYSDIWKESLETYANELFKKLNKAYLNQEPLSSQESDEFIEKVLDDLKHRKEKTNPPPDSLDSYDRIARILEKNKAYPIAAFFYQLGTGKVPETVWKNCTNLPEIIPLEKQVNPPEAGQPHKPVVIPNLVTAGIVFGIGATALGMVLEAWLRPIDRVLYSPLSENQSEIIPPDPVRELSLYLNLLESGDRRKDLQAKNIQNLANFQKQIADIKQRDQIVKSSLYNFLQQLTPPVKPQLDRTYPANEVTADPPLKSPEIALAKSFLKSLGLYTGDITPVWDQSTSTAIQEFQKKYGIESVGGNLGNDTWPELARMIQARQISEVAKNVQKILQESENYSQFKTRFDKLKQCKIPNSQTYSDCLAKIFK